MGKNAYECHPASPFKGEAGIRQKYTSVSAGGNGCRWGVSAHCVMRQRAPSGSHAVFQALFRKPAGK